MHSCFFQTNVTSKIRASVVIAVIVRATNEVAHHGGSAVCNYLGAIANWADVAGAAAHVLFNLFICGKTEFAQNLAGLDFVKLMVAAQQYQDKVSLTSHHCNGFQYFFLRDIQKGCDFLNGFLSGS